MEFEFKGQQYSFPAMLADITLGQRVAFFREHGKALEELSAVADGIKDEFEKELETSMLNIELAIREFSHYTGIPLEVARTEIEFGSLMNIYAVDMALLREQEQNIVLQPDYDWQGCKWVIGAPELHADSSMTLNEFLHAKEVVRQLHKVSQGKWDALPYLCAIYLRKEGEAFSEDLVKEGGERLVMMDSLPLDIAIAVGFFLNDTLSIYMSTLASSGQEAGRESIQRSTLTTGAGSPS